mgnify:CR=1 FL=1
MEVLPMNKSRPVATETVKSLDYTKNILQTIPNNDKMEVTEVISPEKDSPSTINTLMSAVSRSFRKFLEFME